MVSKKKKPSVDLFIKSYILTGCTNAKQAAIDAGYSEKTADQQASRLLKNVKVLEKVNSYKKKELEIYVWSKQDKLKKLELIADSAMKKDPEKGMINMQSAIAAIKEHNL
ncbi:terminase small subunit, partial [Porticoccaceae bacterium]|nr:terminase small subunit [Porticoccaceae bacterium]